MAQRQPSNVKGRLTLWKGPKPADGASSGSTFCTPRSSDCTNDQTIPLVSGQLVFEFVRSGNRVTGLLVTHPRARRISFTRLTRSE